VPSDTSRPPRLLIVDPNLKSIHGHYYGYAARIAEAARMLGVETWIAASDTVTLESSATPILPALSNNYWEELAARDGHDPCIHLAATAQQFADELGRAVRRLGIGSQDVVFLPYAKLVELEGLALLRSVWRDGAPRTILLFRRELDEQGSDTRLGGRAVTMLLRRALAQLTTSPGGDRVRVFTDSDQLTDDYADRLHTAVQTAPIPVDRRFRLLADDKPAKPIVISYFGDARTEKGYQHLPALAGSMSAAIGCGRVRLVLQSNFNVPGGETGITAAREALGRHPNVELLLEPLHDDEYLVRMEASHLVLLPYQADRYVARSSGILAEAVHAGVPVVVPDGTWMAEQLRRQHGAGIPYDGSGTADFVRAVDRAVERLPELLARARTRRTAFVNFHNPDRLARFVCGAAVLDRAAMQVR
jgi:glycosyltransferase involved in cell wall biosynthesis